MGQFHKLIVIAVFCVAALGFAPGPANACTNPAGTPGDIMYNQTSGAFQGCTAAGWKVFYGAVDPCAGTPSVGTVCANGSVFAGNLSGTNRFITPADNGNVAGDFWGCSGANIPAANSASDGETNTAQIMVTCPAAVASICSNLVAHGNDDWYLPAPSEYGLLYTGRVALNMDSGFSYWSSQNSSASNAIRYRFSDATTFAALKNTQFFIRCMRK